MIISQSFEFTVTLFHCVLLCASFAALAQLLECFTLAIGCVEFLEHRSLEGGLNDGFIGTELVR